MFIEQIIYLRKVKSDKYGLGQMPRRETLKQVNIRIFSK